MNEKNLKMKVAILSGGIGPEREVSIASGKALAQALQEYYPVSLIDLESPSLPRELNPTEQVVFPVIHGTFGEDGTLQSMLEESGFAYAGSGPESSRLCMDKALAKRAVVEAGVTVSDAIVFQDPTSLNATEAIEELGSNMILKPTDQGSSVALYILNGVDQLRKTLEQLKPGNWMLERRIFGREFTVGVLHGYSLGIVEVIPNGGVYDYERKYSAGSTEYRFPAVLPIELEQKLKAFAADSFHACNCRDFARVDFMISEDGHPFFLEVNTLPGLTDTSLLPKSASCSGYDFSSLAKKLVEPAISRFNEIHLLPAA